MAATAPRGQTLAMLASLAEWDRYRHDMAEHMGLVVENVHWGRGPAQYPCLVASVKLDEGHVASCYVYAENAVRLLQKAGMMVMPVWPGPAGPFQTMPPGASEPVNSNEVRQLLERVAALHASARENHRHVAALLTALVDILVTEFFIKEPLIEERFTRFLALVDQHGDEKGVEVALDAQATLARRRPPEVK